MIDKSFAYGLVIGLALSFIAWFGVLYLKPMVMEWWEQHKRAKNIALWKRVYNSLILDLDNREAVPIFQNRATTTLPDGQYMEVEVLNADNYYFSITTKDKHIVRGKVDKKLFESMAKLPIGHYILDNIGALPHIV